MKRAVVIFSGGADSATLLYYAKDKGYEINALGFDYGQRNSKELMFATQLAQKINVPYLVVDVSAIRTLLKGSSQTDETIPVQNADSPDKLLRIVPNRNMILLSMAGGYAISLGIDTLFFGIHTGVRGTLPDCSIEFSRALGRTFAKCHIYPLILKAPFVRKTKADIIKLGIKLGVPYRLTWSCFAGLGEPCGVCGACVERREAFESAGVKDPLVTNG